jgi:hypothetical protein
MTTKQLSATIITVFIGATLTMCGYVYAGMDKRVDRSELRLDFNDGLHRTTSERIGTVENVLSNRLTRIETRLDNIDQTLNRLANDIAARARLDARDYPALTKGQTQ